jgi:hypothetical protein
VNEWAERRKAEIDRETAAGGRRHWDEERGHRPAIRSSSKQLRRTETARQRLQVLCRSRCIAVVLQGAELGELEVAIEPKLVDSGIGYGFHVLDLTTIGNVPVVVGCRCGRRHHLDPHKLRAQAWEGQPGKPHVVGVAEVAERSA